jgi:GxxExxY protein
MDTDRESDPLTHSVIKASIDVINGIGHGCSEAIYQRALSLELEALGLQIEREARFPVIYKGVQVGLYIADLVVENSVIIELKVIDGALQQGHLGQCLNYMRLSRISTGLLVNFGRPRLEWKRLKL